MKDRAVTQALAGLYCKEELAKALKGIDIIGDLAVLKLPREWESKRHEIGELLLQRLVHIRGVFRQTAPVCPGSRVREVEWLAGKKETTTTYKEHGCTFDLDISKVYFSPRLSFERLRIAKLARSEEIVVNMFAGVGTFSIVMAKLSGVGRVYSIDNNEDAFGYMVENIKLNRQEGVVVPMLGDAGSKARELAGWADRVLMPLPELAYEYLPYGLGCLRGEGGFVHFYAHQRASSRKEAACAVKNAVKVEAEKHRVVKGVETRVVRSVGRGLYQVVADIEVVGKPV